jgi:hypothetical protein
VRRQWQLELAQRPYPGLRACWRQHVGDLHAIYLVDNAALRGQAACWLAQLEAWGLLRDARVEVQGLAVVEA